ncbi:MAG: hypothetical protein AAGF92_01440 [Myxococcota bacterium]
MRSRPLHLFVAWVSLFTACGDSESTNGTGGTGGTGGDVPDSEQIFGAALGRIELGVAIDELLNFEPVVAGATASIERAHAFYSPVVFGDLSGGTCSWGTLIDTQEVSVSANFVNQTDRGGDGDRFSYARRGNDDNQWGVFDANTETEWSSIPGGNEYIACFDTIDNLGGRDIPLRFCFLTWSGMVTENFPRPGSSEIRQLPAKVELFCAYAREPGPLDEGCTEIAERRRRTNRCEILVPAQADLFSERGPIRCISVGWTSNLAPIDCGGMDATGECLEGRCERGMCIDGKCEDYGCDEPCDSCQRASPDDSWACESDE